jgi:hypothetical protein
MLTAFLKTKLLSHKNNNVGDTINHDEGCVLRAIVVLLHAACLISRAAQNGDILGLSHFQILDPVCRKPHTDGTSADLSLQLNFWNRTKTQDNSNMYWSRFVLINLSLIGTYPNLIKGLCDPSCNLEGDNA